MVPTSVYPLSKYNYNTICDEHIVDMLLPLNTIDEFLINRIIDVKRVQYKKSMIFSGISLLKFNDGYTNTYVYYCFSSI
jgi:hypothetical protein